MKMSRFKAFSLSVVFITTSHPAFGVTVSSRWESCDLNGANYRFKVQAIQVSDSYSRIVVKPLRGQVGSHPCVDLGIGKDAAELAYLMGSPECFDSIPPSGTTGIGTCFLEFAKKEAEAYGKADLHLIDVSVLYCPAEEEGRKPVKLALAMLLTQGHTWYEGHGFLPERPYDATAYLNLKAKLPSLVSLEVIERQFDPQLIRSIVAILGPAASPQKVLSYLWRNHCEEFSLRLHSLWADIMESEARTDLILPYYWVHHIRKDDLKLNYLN